MNYLKLVVWFGIQLLTMKQADWEETNRKLSAFAALQQDDDDEEEDDDDAMVKDPAPAKVDVAKNVFEMETEESNPVTDSPAIIDEADEIT